MVALIALLAACLDPVADCEARARETWGEPGGDGCNDDPHGEIGTTALFCDDVSERRATEWADCARDVEASADVARYGWDEDACAALAEECGIYPN
jgi:hypothetical protein